MGAKAPIWLDVRTAASGSQTEAQEVGDKEKDLCAKTKTAELIPKTAEVKPKTAEPKPKTVELK